MADQKDKAQDKNKQEKLRDEAEAQGGTVITSGGNAGAGKSGSVIHGGTEPAGDEPPEDKEQKS